MKKEESLVVYSQDFVFRLIEWLRTVSIAKDLMEHKITRLDGKPSTAKDIVDYFIDSNNGNLATTEFELSE